MPAAVTPSWRRKQKLRRKNAEHQSAAIFGHFHGAEFRPGEDAGNISIYNFEHGWMWMIPLPDGVMSVGAVCRPEYFKQRRGRTEEFLLETLQLNPALWKRMEKAELIGQRGAGHRQLFLRSARSAVRAGCWWAMPSRSWTRCSPPGCTWR